MPKRALQPECAVEELSILDAPGQAVTALEPELNHDLLLRIYRAMVLTRKLDERMITMQRQGEMGTFAPGRGQEATQIGQVFPLEDRDWYSPSYRSFGAQLWRGWSMEQLMLLWGGYFEGFAPPEGVNDLPFSIVVGAHVPVAVGVGMGLKHRDTGAVILTNFGDGASSEGDVSEALNFAAVFKAPVVFVCENNGYAISVPLEQQTAVKSLAHRGPAFGMPGIRVDGNDVLAMIVATQRAVARARAGDGPTLIEAVTFRMEMHTTADDPTVYRNEEEVVAWQRKDPIARFGKYLVAKGATDEKTLAEIDHDLQEQVRAARDRYRERARPNPHEVFDFVYSELTPELIEQQREYQLKLPPPGDESGRTSR
ncbi:MAG: pyruvate dehydrogenase (acetyl-transferring) E1 component subunit alpha [Planctomycetes bacterium]|nr:pyruvate dehydrogenase (acetyl-transferring) E1 component subunit alpha [Planctomycetota bacterium]